MTVAYAWAELQFTAPNKSTNETKNSKRTIRSVKPALRSQPEQRTHSKKNRALSGPNGIKIGSSKPTGATHSQQKKQSPQRAKWNLNRLLEIREAAKQTAISAGRPILKSRAFRSISRLLLLNFCKTLLAYLSPIVAVRILPAEQVFLPDVFAFNRHFCNNFTIALRAGAVFGIHLIMTVVDGEMRR